MAAEKWPFNLDAENICAKEGVAMVDAYSIGPRHVLVQVYESLTEEARDELAFNVMHRLGVERISICGPQWSNPIKNYCSKRIIRPAQHGTSTQTSSGSR